MYHFAFWLVKELKVKTNSENVWYFSTSRSVQKVRVERKIPFLPSTHRHRKKIHLTAGRCQAGF